MITLEAHRLRHRMDPPRADRFTVHAAPAIASLRSETEPVPGVGEPLVEVGSDDGVFDVGLCEDIAHGHSRPVDRLVEEITAQPGADSAFREDREVVLVTAPDRNAEQLQRWVPDRLTGRLPAAC